MSRQSLDIDHFLHSSHTSESELAECLVESYASRLRHLACLILRDSGDADDALQDILLTAVRKRHLYRAGSSPDAWIYTLAVNVCRGYLRRRARHSAIQHLLEVFQPGTDHRPTPEEYALHSEASEQLWAAVNRLGEKHRLPVILHYLEGFSTKEAAQILGIKHGTLRSRLHYACKQIYGFLERTGFEMREE